MGICTHWVVLYNVAYTECSLVLQILIWEFFFTFLGFSQNCTYNLLLIGYMCYVVFECYLILHRMYCEKFRIKGHGAGIEIKLWERFVMWTHHLVEIVLVN